jgi:DNA-binding CsgD family transcriptional regulator
MDGRRNLEPPEMPVTARQTEACRYRRQGHSYREIGRMMGISSSAAHEHAASALRIEGAYRKATVEEVREIELDRLDALLLVATTMMEDENRPDRIRLAAIDRVLSIGERRSKLLGLDNAERPADDSFITDKDTLVREIRERFASARAKLVAEAAATLRREVFLFVLTRPA